MLNASQYKISNTAPKKVIIKGCLNHACAPRRSRNNVCAMKYKRQEVVVERKEVGKDSVQAASLNALNFCL